MATLALAQKLCLTLLGIPGGSRHANEIGIEGFFESCDEHTSLGPRLVRIAAPRFHRFLRLWRIEGVRVRGVSEHACEDKSENGNNTRNEDDLRRTKGEKVKGLDVGLSVAELSSTRGGEKWSVSGRAQIGGGVAVSHLCQSDDA